MSISAASVQDRDVAEDAVTSSMSKYPSLNTLFIDSAYAEKWAQRTQHKSTYREMTFRTKRFVHDSADYKWLGGYAQSLGSGTDSRLE